MNKIFLFSVLTLNFLYSCSLTNSTKLKGNKALFGKSNSGQHIISEEIRQLDQLVSSEETIITENVDLQEIDPQQTSDFATLSNDLYPSEKINTKILDNSCDRITFLNGNEEEVKLIELGDDYIKYKRCDNLDGPTFNISKSKVFMIVYSNGNKEVIEHNTADEKPKYQQQTKNNNNQYNSSGSEINGFAIASFISGILGFIPLLGIILGVIANNQITKNPNKYKGKGFAIAGIALSFFWIFILLLFLI
jgi:hypothetical protein